MIRFQPFRPLWFARTINTRYFKISIRRSPNHLTHLLHKKHQKVCQPKEKPALLMKLSQNQRREKIRYKYFCANALPRPKPIVTGFFKNIFELSHFPYNFGSKTACEVCESDVKGGGY